MCENGHALIAAWIDGKYVLMCANPGCTYTQDN